MQARLLGAGPARPATLAFSLVELSIVLVILGLLVGGVLTGQSLVRASELRSVSVDYQRYTAAMLGFRDKYFALPGDMNNAVKFWGAAAGASTDGMDATCAALLVASTSKTTCNGDGNGVISDASYSNEGYEVYRAWQHLSNAGLIEGQFAGVRNGFVWYPTPGVQSPRSRVGTASWRLRYLGNTAGDVYYWPSDYGHMLEFYNTLAGTPELKPEEAWNIDTKLDDGKPGYGKVMVLRYTNAMTASVCTTSDTQSTTAYALTSGVKECYLIFKLGF